MRRWGARALRSGGPLFAIVLITCAPTGGIEEAGPDPEPACRRSAPSTAAAYDTSRSTELAGVYALTLIGTTRGSEGSRGTARLTLRVADTLERYYRRGWPPVRRMLDRPLIGTIVSPLDTLRTDGATVAGDTLFLGCAPGDCFDGWLIRLRIRSTSPTGFWGEWEDRQEGMGRLVDSSGRWLPDPKGYYCARRLIP